MSMAVKTQVSGKQVKVNEYTITEDVPRAMKMARGIFFSITQSWGTRGRVTE